MKIAYINYEYPPDTLYGGIATSVFQTAQVMNQRGHKVEVFTCSPYRSGTENEDGVIVHRICEQDRLSFIKQIGPVFAERHRVARFDIMESPEYGADARIAICLVPDIPFVVKLHTPSYLMYQLNGIGLPILTKIRREIGSIRRKMFDRRYWLYLPDQDIECNYARKADLIISPSKLIAQKLIFKWSLNPQKTVIIPHPYMPSDELLKIPVETQTKTITFIGRLSIQKGILELAKAIPKIIECYPQTKFILAGSIEMDMRQYLEEKLKKYLASIKFTGHVSYPQIASILKNTDICIFPSHWESFGMVCLEAMSAGRGVIVTKTSGMAEIINQGKFGHLVAPRSSNQIAKTAIKLLARPAIRMKLGQTARQHVINQYNGNHIGSLLEAAYIRAIASKNTN